VVPSAPFELLGFSELPEVGTLITSSKQEVKPIKEEEKTQPVFDIKSLFSKQEEQKQLAVIIKADSQGTLDAIISQLEKNPLIKIILSSVGSINRSDIFLAKTTKSIVIGFSVSYDAEVRSLAKQEKVIIKTYEIIYELLDELEEVADILLEKEQKEKSLKAQAKILATFVIEGETVFGALITKGRVNVGDMVEVYRGENLTGKSKLVSLKIRAKSVTEVKKDQECGMVFSPQLDIKVGDVVKYTL
jgi:translation initiation factor IF-2